MSSYRVSKVYVARKPGYVYRIDKKHRFLFWTWWERLEGHTYPSCDEAARQVDLLIESKKPDVVVYEK